MGKGKIGLKLADGKFYPVLEEGEASRKRLVVTTVQDGQRSVQIDLYRGEGPSVEGSDYIGSLVIEGVPPMAKGQPDIRMEVSLDGSQTLSAYAEESSTGASQSLKVSLKSLSDEEKYEIPDFEFANGEAEASFADEDFADTDQLPSEQAGLLARDESTSVPAASGRKPLLIALFSAAILIAALGLAYLVYRLALAPRAAPSPEAKPVAAQPAPAQPTAPAAPAPAAPAQAATPAAPAPAPATAAKPAPAQAAPPAAPAPASAPAAGAWYKIKWGDTLWDLAFAYYRNPWYYPRIAKANKIKNPDRIISGTKIWIPKL